MSYGYQDPWMQPSTGRNPPSFGPPPPHEIPGIPSASHPANLPMSSYPNHIGFNYNTPPTSFSMPQPYPPPTHFTLPPPPSQNFPGYPHPSPYPSQSYPYAHQTYDPSGGNSKYSQHTSLPFSHITSNIPQKSYDQLPTSIYPNQAYPGGQRAGNSSSSLHSIQPNKFSQSAPQRNEFCVKLSPTVVATPDFNPRADAEILRKAMKGFGTDEKAIINVLANRSNLQRQEIATQFKTLYGKDLIKDLKSETSGNFESLLLAMMQPLPQYYAKELHDAMSGIGTDECVLIEVMCTMSNHEIHVIRHAYEMMYGRSLEDDLRGDTSGNFERLMVSLCCGNRDESFNIDPSAAMEDARQLLQAGELRFGTDESVFNAILVQRNVPQLRQIFAEYQNITGHTIEEAIENEFSGDVKKGLSAIVKCVKDRAGFFAEQLHKSMRGMGTNDRRLIRLIVTRSEIDMGEIKQAFLRNYGQSLENFISEDCSGDYKKCLLALIS